jgi:hypothetical protein
MRWIRSHRRLGSRLALFALAVQIVLSFGHVHLDKIAPPSAATSAVSLLDTAPRDKAPVAPGHHGGANDFCAICATIALVASSVLPEAAQLAPPLAAPFTRLGECEAARPAFALPFSFQARAPPAIG